ncbi:sensor domain-containing diguanylate cyclase [Cellulomonas sp. KRMCY2]|uniref:sensor domain-containing diguanylate cyclase n=1 Tax=Cellulomonas sp. KRMCY2 TaxID=1304865 RepID=UPI00045E914F|nr:sensor domain-containing diguanylate cyclase [Cellulomonas sp. KRMCY2]
MLTPDLDLSPVLPRIPKAIGAVAAAGAAIPAFSWLKDAGLVVGPPVTLALLLLLIFVCSGETVQTMLGGGRIGNRPLLRLVVASGVLAALCWTAGWSAFLPATAVLVGVIHIQRSGSWIWPIVGGVVTTFAVLGELGVALGLLPTVVAPEHSHIAALVMLGLAWLGIASVGTSVAERERSQNALARAEARLRALMESSTDVLTVSNSLGLLTYVSPAVERAMGYAPDALVGSPLLNLVDADYRTDVQNILADVIRQGTGARARLDVLVVHASLERRWYEWTVHNLLHDPLVEGFVVDQRDVTERLLHSEALAHAAAHDDLTGLANRGELMRRLAACLPEATPGAGVAVLFIDLDRFKEVNDTYGHAAGDSLLTVISERLKGCLRAHDHLARLGGDEFCAILTEVNDGAEVTTIVNRLAAAVQQPVVLRTGTVQVGVSVGAALATDGRCDPAALFAASDAAMYQVKNRRRRNDVLLRTDPAPSRRGSDGEPTGR